MNNYMVRILSEARFELRDIANYYKLKVGAVSAKKITNRILDNIDKLSEFPEMGMVPPFTMIAEAGYRMLIIDEYLCFHNIVENNIFVSHIVHGSVDYMKRLL